MDFLDLILSSDVVIIGNKIYKRYYENEAAEFELADAGFNGEKYFVCTGSVMGGTPYELEKSWDMTGCFNGYKILEDGYDTGYFLKKQYGSGGDRDYYKSEFKKTDSKSTASQTYSSSSSSSNSWDLSTIIASIFALLPFILFIIGILSLRAK